jgi:hypothetical protein
MQKKFEALQKRMEAQFADRLHQETVKKAGGEERNPGQAPRQGRRPRR